MTRPTPAPFFTADRVIAGLALIVAVPASLLTLGTAVMTKLYFSPTAAAHFAERVGRPLLGAAVVAAGAAVVAAALLLSTVRQSRPLVAGMSALLSLFAIVVSLHATAEHRRRLDPRPQLTEQLKSLDLGPDATVVLRTSLALPHLPEVRWVYRVPLRRAEACARARAALEAWADRGMVRQGTTYACALDARRGGSAVNVNVSPEGAPLTRGPTLQEESLNPPVHYVMVELSACTGGSYPCT